MRQDLLQKALKSIEAKPEHFCMRWFARAPLGTPGFYEYDMALVAKEPECGTTFCLAGWVVHEAIKEGFEPEGINVSEAALDALEIQGRQRGFMESIFLQTQLDYPELKYILAATGFIDPGL